jgi:hypothetical protein
MPIWKNKKFGFVMKYRSFPFGEGDGGWGWLKPFEVCKTNIS